MSPYPTGNSPEIQRYNEPRECIRRFFPNRKCFVFVQPADRRDLVHLEELQDCEIDPEFQQQVEKFCRHIWEKSSPKAIPGGCIVTGTCEYGCAEGWVGSSSWDRLGREEMQSQMMQVGKGRCLLLAAALASGFGSSGGWRWVGKSSEERFGQAVAGRQQGYGRRQGRRGARVVLGLQIPHPRSSLAVLGKLAEAYVEAIQSGAVPCLESAVLTLAKIANAAAVEEAVKLYQDLMEQRAKLPTETVEELLDLHIQCEREALELFQKQAFEEDLCHFQADLTVGGPQPGRDSPGDTIVPLALGKQPGPGAQGSPCLLPEDTAVPSPEETPSHRLLSHSADCQLSLLHDLFCPGSKAVLEGGGSSSLPPLLLQPTCVCALAGSREPSTLPLSC